MRMYSTGQGPRSGITFSASWDLLATPWVDMGNGVYLPEAFNARFEVEDDHSVEMTVAVEEGVAVCNDLRMIRHPKRASLSGHELRRVPTADWVAFACSMVGFPNQGGVKTTDAEFASEEARKDVDGSLRRAKRRGPLTPDFLRDVARVYKANVGSGAPVEAVREAFGPMGHSTAARYIKLARDEGLLPKTTRGKVTR